jgi:hypothetical protein
VLAEPPPPPFAPPEPAGASNVVGWVAGGGATVAALALSRFCPVTVRLDADADADAVQVPVHEPGGVDGLQSLGQPGPEGQDRCRRQRPLLVNRGGQRRPRHVGGGHPVPAGSP